MKSAAHQSIAIGWETRRFHYMKSPKPLNDYLKPALSPEQKRAKGNRAVLDMMLRAKKRRTTDGTR